MTDNKQKKEQFRAIVSDEVDKLFAVPLTEKQMDNVAMTEIGDTLNEVTLMNNAVTDLMADDVETMRELDGLQKDVNDIQKLRQVRADLDKAA